MKCFKKSCETSPGKEQIICPICKIEFTAKKSKQRKFCSRECVKNSYKSGRMHDIKNPNYRKGSRVYRARAFAHYLNECFVCKTIEKKLYVHHINPSHEVNNVENLRILCASCHVRIHNGALPPGLLDITSSLDD